MRVPVAVCAALEGIGPEPLRCVCRSFDKRGCLPQFTVFIGVAPVFPVFQKAFGCADVLVRDQLFQRIQPMLVTGVALMRTGSGSCGPALRHERGARGYLIKF